MPVKLQGDPGDVCPSGVRLPRPLRYVGNFTAKQFDQAIHRLRVTGAQVVYPSRMRRFCSSKECLGDIGYVEKITRLRTVANDRIRRASELLTKEYAKYRTIRTRSARARAVRIEDADGVDRQFVNLVPLERSLLALVL